MRIYCFIAIQEKKLRQDFLLLKFNPAYYLYRTDVRVRTYVRAYILRTNKRQLRMN